MQEFAKSLPEPVQMFTDFRKMCRSKEVDAIFVGSPNQLHVPMALEAVRCDKHVLVTKPLADNEQAAAKLVKAAEAAGVVNMMSLSTRFSPECRYLGGLIGKGQFGELYYGRARSIRRSGIPAWNLGFIQQGGGAFRDMGVHVLDAAWWLLGRPRPVSVTGVAGAKFGPRGQGYWDFQAPREEGLPAVRLRRLRGRFHPLRETASACRWRASGPPTSRRSSSSSCSAPRPAPATRPSPSTAPRTARPRTRTSTLPRGPSAWDNIAAHFLDCIAKGKPCDAPLRDGLVVQQMMEGLLRSAETGKEVRFRD